MSDSTCQFTCQDCGERNPVREAACNPPSCPTCGCRSGTLEISVIEVSRASTETVNIVGKNPSLPSKKKKRIEYFAGPELTKATEKMSQKERLIDKTTDRYMERVVDPETGEVLHHCEEPLLEHIGHGSAKKGST